MPNLAPIPMSPEETAAYEFGRADGYKEAEKTFAHLFASVVAKQGGEYRFFDDENLDPDRWVVERHRDMNEPCTVFKVYERVKSV